MSHALCIVAISPEDILKAGGVEEAVDFQMEPFEESSWFSEGSRWDWFEIGGRWNGVLGGVNIVTRSEFSVEAWREFKRDRTRKMWAEIAAKPQFRRSYDVAPEDTLESDLAKIDASDFSAYAFLRNRRWCEGTRMGWWGMDAATECAIKAEKLGEDYEGRCIFKHESGASVVTWEQDESKDAQWKQLYFARFIRQLPDDTTLVAVDYHV